MKCSDIETFILVASINSGASVNSVLSKGIFSQIYELLSVKFPDLKKC